jgi:cytochrome c553
MKGVAALFALLVGFSSPAWGQSEPAKPDAAKGQTLATQVCAACHGADGNSPAPANPKLAGQMPEYIARQLAAFKENKDRKNPVMFAMASPLSPQDMQSVAAYYGAQKAKDGAARNKDTIALGRKLYRGGDSAKGLPACASCHGATGAGMPALYPRLAGQHAEYTELQLKAFRSKDRANDPSKMMRAIAEKMSDAEIQAVSDYIAGLR